MSLFITHVSIALADMVRSPKNFKDNRGGPQASVAQILLCDGFKGSTGRRISA